MSLKDKEEEEEEDARVFVRSVSPSSRALTRRVDGSVGVLRVISQI